MKIRNERLAAVATGTAIVVLLGSATAYAAGKITSEDIQNRTIQAEDISKPTLRDLHGERGPRGPEGPEGPQGPPGQPFQYQGAHWSIIDRNVIGNGDSYLRPGPDNAPAGVGSLGLRTGSNEDKAAFGNQVDFVGKPLADYSTLKYSVFTTGENNDKYAENLPSLAMEVDPSGSEDSTSPNYSTLVFVPTAIPANQWSEEDATSAQRWFLTGSAGTASGCNQVTYCTLDQVKAFYPNATLLTVEITKGRDYAFSGAVDNLVINDTTYDFEPTGVVTTTN